MSRRQAPTTPGARAPGRIPGRVPALPPRPPTSPLTPAELTQRALAGDRRALARMITLVEAGYPAALDVLWHLPVRRRLAPGHPHVIGITGPPGAGKSTFTDRLIASGRRAGERVAVVAVDPASPFSGGAILGDRVRMEGHGDDDGVYIRSLSSRGFLGGLSQAAGAVVELLDAVGYDRVLVETVGVGQGELSVMAVADTVLVVLTPESGDTVQAMKAGLMEIADVFVVNKADRSGADALVRELQQLVSLDPGQGWKAPVCATSALRGEGTTAVEAAIFSHRQWIEGPGADAWRQQMAEGRVSAWLDRVAARARAEAEAWLRGRPEEAALRAGQLRPETLLAPSGVSP